MINQKNENQNSGTFSAVFQFRTERKRSRAEPRWKSFSSSYDSSQLGSDSSLVYSLFACNKKRRIWLTLSPAFILVMTVPVSEVSSWPDGLLPWIWLITASFFFIFIVALFPLPCKKYCKMHYFYSFGAFFLVLQKCLS